jgi:allantoinase
VPYSVEARGRKVVVVPYNVPGCNDYSTYGSGRTPRDLLQIMKDQFDYLYWEGQQGSPKYWAVNLHPFVSGVPYRTKIMDEFITYAKSFPDVWFARRLEIANWCLKQGY